MNIKLCTLRNIIQYFYSISLQSQGGRRSEDAEEEVEIEDDDDDEENAEEEEEDQEVGELHYRDTVNFPNIVRTLSSPASGRRVRSELWNFTLGDVSSANQQQYESGGQQDQSEDHPGASSSANVSQKDFYF